MQRDVQLRHALHCWCSVLPLVQTEMKKVDEEHEILEPLNRVVDDKQVR